MGNKRKDCKHLNKEKNKIIIKKDEINSPDEILNLNESEERPGIGYEILKIPHTD